MEVFNLFCSMDPFESPVKPTDLFSQKCIYIHKINDTDTDYISIYLQRKPIMLKYSFQNIKKQIHNTVIQCFVINLLNQQDNKYI